MLKIIFILFVGKSSITLRFVYGNFPDAYDTTIEDIYTKPYKFNGKQFALQITDTAGQVSLCYAIIGYSCEINCLDFKMVRISNYIGLE